MGGLKNMAGYAGVAGAYFTGDTVPVYAIHRGRYAITPPV